MIVDVLFKYDGREVTVKSDAAKHLEVVPANIGLSRERESELEQIEFIGLNMTAEEMAHDSRVPESYKINRVFRVINPFQALKSEPQFAYRTIDFFCKKSHVNIKPQGIWGKFCGLDQSEWKLSNLIEMRSSRILLGLDRFDLTVQIADYRFVSIDKKEDFEKLLRKITRKFKTEPL